jgi:methylsterol monooxygenase
MSFTNNFSTSFRWCDRLFGTDTKYREYRARVQASKSAMKSASKDERALMEQKLIDEVTVEGLKAEAEIEGSAPKTIKIQ